MPTGCAWTAAVRGGHAGGFFLSNITLSSQKLFRGFELSASIYNLVNNRYGDPVSEELRQNIIEQDGRTFRFKLSYHFARKGADD